ncbi:MAG: hypothetical protein H6703_00620 [Myxococcales bacterium]|nr:hypothetical protein [Myxococcales bacterium]
MGAQPRRGRGGEAPPLPAGVTLAVVPSPRRDRAAIHLRVAAGQATVPDPLLGAAQIAAQALGAPLAGATPTVTLGPEGCRWRSRCRRRGSATRSSCWPIA